VTLTELWHRLPRKAGGSPRRTQRSSQGLRMWPGQVALGGLLEWSGAQSWSRRSAEVPSCSHHAVHRLSRRCLPAGYAASRAVVAAALGAGLSGAVPWSRTTTLVLSGYSGSSHGSWKKASL